MDDNRTVDVTIILDRALHEYAKKLMITGVYGADLSEVLAAGLRYLVVEGIKSELITPTNLVVTSRRARIGAL